MAADGTAHHALESGHAVMVVDHERAGREIGEETALVPRSGSWAHGGFAAGR